MQNYTFFLDLCKKSHPFLGWLFVLNYFQKLSQQLLVAIIN